MEICDIHDETGQRTGRTAVRGTTLALGEYYLAVQVWIRDETGAYLIQRRALHLVSAPGIWATTAGYAWAGEESINAAIREVNEELGLPLSPEQFQRFARLRMTHQIEDVWLANVLRDAVEPTLSEEVMDWKWASKHEITEMIGSGEFFAYSYFDTLPE